MKEQELQAPMANAIDDVKEWVLVPKVPTEAMYAAAEREWDGRMSARSRGVWQAMLAAASPSPAPSQHTGWSNEAVEAAAIAIAKIRMKEGMPPAIAAMVQFDEVFMQRWNGKTDVDLKQVAAYRADAIAALTAASSIAPATGFEVKVIKAPWPKQPMVFMTGENEGVLFDPQGKLHGWIMRQHPDGMWVSVRKLEAVDPEDNPFSRLFSITDKTGKEPCGECHLQPGETCDVCNATAPRSPSVAKESGEQ